MAPRSSRVTSHRMRHRQARAVSLVAVGVVAVALVGLGGYALVSPSPSGCSGMDSDIVVVVSAPDASAMRRLAANWSAAQPAVNGGCVRAAIVEKASFDVASMLGSAWDERRDGPRPDVWIPDSSLWLSVAASRPSAAALIPKETTSVASSPVVLAVREPLALALGWPSRTLSWSDVIGSFHRPDVWTTAGHPDWAALRVGLTDPAQSTAGLAAVLYILGSDPSGQVGEAQLIAGLGLSRVVGAVAPDTTAFFAAQSSPGEGPNSVVAAFPALERDVAAHGVGNSVSRMAPVYNVESPVVADYPYAVLSASWVSDSDRAAADQFRRYLLSAPAQAVLGDAGLRAPDRTVLSRHLMPAEAGFPQTISAPRPVPDPKQLSSVMAEWANLQRRVNVLLLLDTSGSMITSVPGTTMTRLSLLKQIAYTGFGVFPTNMSVGLWEFSIRPNDASEYREAVPFGPVDGNVGTMSRRAALAGAVPQLRAEGFTPLYNTVYAAFHEIQRQWEPGSTNTVVLFTDGINEMTSGLTLEDLISLLSSEQRPDMPVHVVCVGLGPDTDAEALSRIAGVTGGRSFVVTDPSAAIKTLVLAFAGRLQ